MIDIFVQKDVAKLLKHKKVVFLGDSNIRALYKDMLCLIHQTKLISQKTLKTKMENSCFGDKLLTNGPKTNGRCYREERIANVNNSEMSFYFLTCVYDKYVQEILNYISKKSNMPDVLVINSVLWDVTRWGPNGVESFKKNLVKLMKEIKRLMPDCLVIWVTAPPIAAEIKGGFLVKELEFLKYSLRFHVMEANFYARKIVVNHGFDILDSHYHLKLQIHRREVDGIHWMPHAVRYVTNLLLTHISKAWNVPLPQRYKSNVEAENSEYIPEEILETESNNIKDKSTLKIASVIEKPTNFALESPKIVNEIKEKENLEKEGSCKRKRKSLKKRRQEKQRFQESHHAYLKRDDRRQRNERIRNWKSSVCAYTPTETVADTYDTTASLDDQHDSGYISSPQTSSLLGTPQFHYVNPAYYSSCHPNSLLSNPNSLLSNPNSLLSNPNSLLSNPNSLLSNPNSLLPNPYSLFPNPYPYQGNVTQTFTQNYYTSSRQVIISSNPRPYSFPNSNSLNFQPVIDFTQDVPVGFRFNK